MPIHSNHFPNVTGRRTVPPTDAKTPPPDHVPRAAILGVVAHQSHEDAMKQIRTIEKMHVGDALRLATELGIPLESLLDASLSLSRDLVDIESEGNANLAKIGDSDRARAV